MDVAILILGAGSSTRMGKPKQTLSIGKTTLLGLSIENALQANAKNVYCVLGANAEIIIQSISKYNIEVIINDNHKKGLSSSIVSGIQHIQDKNFDAVLIMLADQPHVDFNYLNTLIQSFEKNPTKVSASKYKKNNGVPAIFPKALYQQLLKLKEDKGAKDFLNTHKTEVISIQSDKLLDIDTQDDYQNFLKSL